jgi:hypothetical protein
MTISACSPSPKIAMENADAVSDHWNADPRVRVTVAEGRQGVLS